MFTHAKTWLRIMNAYLPLNMSPSWLWVGQLILFLLPIQDNYLGPLTQGKSVCSYFCCMGVSLFELEIMCLVDAKH